MNDFEKIKIIDNYLPEKIMLDLENFLLSNNFPYYYVENIVLGFEKSDSFMFVHHLIENQKESSTVGNSIVNMIMNNVPHKNILRAKINFYLKTDCLQLHDFHLDNPHEDIKIAIFYINTNNGFTEFEDKTIVNSVRNRLVLFPGNLKHRSTNTTNKKNRINININYN
jgi:hypothetical protein